MRLTAKHDHAIDQDCCAQERVDRADRLSLLMFAANANANASAAAAGESADVNTGVVADDHADGAGEIEHGEKADDDETGRRGRAYQTEKDQREPTWKPTCPRRRICREICRESDLQYNEVDLARIERIRCFLLSNSTLQSGDDWHCHRQIQSRFGLVPTLFGSAASIA